MVIGTAAYMAPEQAKGKVVDKRADVWAFGAVLFEMLTGQKPFVGDDVSDTLAAVLRAEVDLDALPDGTPATLCRVIGACLRRDPKQRVHDVADVRLAMEGTFETTVSAPSEPIAVAQLQVWQRPIPVALALLAALAVGGLSVWALTRPATRACGPSYSAARWRPDLQWPEPPDRGGRAHGRPRGLHGRWGPLAASAGPDGRDPRVGK